MTLFSSEPIQFPQGFVGNGGAVGLKKSGKPDLGVLFSERSCSAAGMFTTNKFTGANIPYCHRVLKHGVARGILIHSGQANVCTGKAGDVIARQILDQAAGKLSCKPEELFLGSTGVIGQAPDTGKLAAGLDTLLAQGVSREGLPMVARAMMTTDLTEKVGSRTVTIHGKKVVITGFAKGSGMIHPNMATMLCYLFTDATIDATNLEKAFRGAINRSFNCLTVDGDTSTSDMVVMLANGAAGNASLVAGSAEFEAFTAALTDLAQELARKVAADGEGATKLVTIRVTGAADEADAQRVGKAVGNSNLVKTALFGNDPNWGRLACAVGYSGAAFEPEGVSILLEGELIFQANEPIPFDKAAMSMRLKAAKEVLIEIDLGAGSGAATIWTCDFSYDYVKINAEYTT
jgi:glutamate N-acetyltransferase/amino-acid N-acetyltransferase